MRMSDTAPRFSRETLMAFGGMGTYLRLPSLFGVGRKGRGAASACCVAYYGHCGWQVREGGMEVGGRWMEVDGDRDGDDDDDDEDEDNMTTIKSPISPTQTATNRPEP